LLSAVNTYAVLLAVMNGRQRNVTNTQIWGKYKTRFMMATVPHVTSGSGLRKFQVDGFFNGVYLTYQLHVSAVSN